MNIPNNISFIEFDLVRGNVMQSITKFKLCNTGGLFRSSGANKFGYTKRSFILFLFKLEKEGLIRKVSNNDDTELKWSLNK